MTIETEDVRRERIWDLPTRLFHWALVISVTSGWLLGEFMSFNYADLHVKFGYVTGGLVVFRLIWGVVGPPPARLARLVPGLGEIRAYLAHLFSREPSHWPGHNPLGALSVLAMLIALIVQVSTGLFSYSDSYFTGGPLAEAVSSATQNQMNAVHHIFHDVVLILVALHVAAISFYAVWKRENLVGPMITGWKFVRRRRD